MKRQKDNTIPEKMYFSITSFTMGEINHLFTDDTISQSSGDQEDEDDLKNEKKREILKSRPTVKMKQEKLNSLNR